MTRFALAALALVPALACSKTYIPNTDVEDNSTNRKIITFCEQYRHALEDKNIGAILQMVSPAYFEDAGTVRGEDDVDYEGLKKFLLTDFMKTLSVRYEIRYRRITFTETNHVYVDYTYAGAYKIPGVTQDEWHRKVADNRLDLVPDGDSFKIVAGM